MIYVGTPLDCLPLAAPQVNRLTEYICNYTPRIDSMSKMVHALSKINIFYGMYSKVTH